MKIVILGAGCGIPSLEFSAPGILLETADGPLLFDMGPGSLVRLLKLGVSYTQLRWVFLTHFHSDHAGDLAPLIQALWTTPFYARTEPLTILGPIGLDKFLRNLAAAFGDWIYEPEFPLEIKEMEQSVFSLPSLRISTSPMNHGSKNAVGYRIEDAAGKSIVYSGDTDVTDEIIHLAHEADALILECSFPEKRKLAGHLIPEEAAEIAKVAQCKHLILTHFYPPQEELFAEIREVVPKIFKGKLSLAQDFMTVSV
ncbi:MAG: MBL fold metallo-hydrolase [Calditrichaeota bacterium]|nr:MBL fold metallo-hydrolase [Calditrichota bacterium]